MAHTLPSNFVTNQTGLMKGFADWAFNVTLGWFWTGVLATFCFVLFVSASRYSTDRAFGYATTTGLLGALFLMTLNLMPWKIGLIFIVAGVIGIVWMIIRKE